MRLVRFAPSAFFLLLLSGPSFAQGFHTFISKEDSFSVHVPCEFSTQDITWKTEYGSMVPARVYSCTRGPETYRMTVVNYSNIEAIHKARLDKTEADVPDLYWRIDVNGSAAYAATRLREKAVKVSFDSFQLIDLIPGHQLHFTNPGRNPHLRRNLSARVPAIHPGGDRAPDRAARPVSAVLERPQRRGHPHPLSQQRPLPPPVVTMQ